MSQTNHPLLFELLRSFTTLAETLNLSRAVSKLDTTRQTVRRHINILEEIKGERLFIVDDRQYHLTDSGRRYYREALDIQARGLAWMNNETRHVGGLFHISKEETNGWGFYLQQHPISDIWEDQSDLMRRAVAAWATAKGDVTEEAFDDIRPDMMVFRKSGEGWLCSAVGSNSSYATWYGRQWEHSSIGRALPSLPGGQAHASQLSQPFEEVRATRGLRYDHVHTSMNRQDDAPLEPISFKRLLLGGRYPDDSFALISIIVRSYDLRILGVPKKMIYSMPAKWVMDDSASLASESAEQS
ncbi:MAG: LysR family transcriptional regulator [Thalassovita sp.]